MTSSPEKSKYKVYSYLSGLGSDKSKYKVYSYLSGLGSDKSKYKVYSFLSGLGCDKSVDVEKRKAAEMKMFGKLTRQTVEWIPTRILCVRYKILLKWNLDDLISSYSLLQSCNSHIRFIMLPFQSLFE